MTRKSKVLIVDDSALIRKILQEILDQDPELEVVGTAADPYFARDKIKTLAPDVLTLDIEMPRMDGISFLRNLMRLHPMPVVMISTLTEKGADATLEALELGAVDYVAKPKDDLRQGLGDYAEEICSKVKAAARARVRGEPAAPAAKRLTRSGKRSALIAIGSSTGGTEALRDVLQKMPPDSPPIVVAQHIPEAFSGPFAARMDRSSPMSVCEATDGQKILPGHVYIAPGNHHMRVRAVRGDLFVWIDQTEKVNRHRPSVDVLFDSVAATCGRDAVGVILTGMGADGAQGLLRMKEAGARTIAQDEATSVVWGMPGSAVRLGAADEVLPLAKIAEAALSLATR